MINHNNHNNVLRISDPTNVSNHATRLAFLDDHGGRDVQRFDVLKYRQFEKLTEKQLGYFWQPAEIDITRDARDFNELNPWEQHIFTANLKRQIILDSVQSRSPNLVFLPLATIPELETWIETWAFNETIHSRSYTHIIRNIYSDPSKVFDEMSTIPEIMACARDITDYYDKLYQYSSLYQILGEGLHTINNNKVSISKYELKKLLWLALVSVNVLEGIRFYVSFACSWAFAELKKMEGNAKIIKLIARDENIHLAFTQSLLKLLPSDDPDYVSIRNETQAEMIEMYDTAINQEKAWADYLFKDGSMIGINTQLLHEYIEWIGNKRMIAIGLPSTHKIKSNPLPWTAKWIAGSDVQVAPQEVETSSYIIGGTKQDVTEDTFKGMSL